MRRILLASLIAAVLPVAPACRKAAVPKVESRAETKSTNPNGSRSTTTTETKQFGATLISKTERTESGGDRKEKLENETVVGTVTDYRPGKKIVILTGDGKKHDYDLSEKKTASSIDPRVTVGTKVRLDLSRDDSGSRSVRVIPASDR